MKSQHILNFFLGIYIFIFLTYLFGPLIIMSITSFNSAEFPSITPWECFSWRWFQEGKIAYDGQHLAGLSSDWRLHDGLIKSLINSVPMYPVDPATKIFSFCIIYYNCCI